MYALYEKEVDGNISRYCFKEQISLFGCNSGYIPWLLQKQLNETSTEPFPWHMNIEKALHSVDQPNQTLIINLKPNSKEPNLSLYEIIDTWGYSSSGWTPVMFYLRGLFIDEDPSKFDDRNFQRNSSEIEDPIFSMMYLRGTVSGGSIKDRWTPPGPSPTNSVLLWPDTFEYFAQEANKIMERMA